MLEYKAKNKRTKETLLTCLADLFYSIVTQKRKVRSTDDMIIFSVVFLNMNFNRWGRSLTTPICALSLNKHPTYRWGRLPQKSSSRVSGKRRWSSTTTCSRLPIHCHQIFEERKSRISQTRLPGCPRVPDLPDQPHQRDHRGGAACLGENTWTRSSGSAQ